MPYDTMTCLCNSLLLDEADCNFHILPIYHRSLFLLFWLPNIGLVKWNWQVTHMDSSTRSDSTSYRDMIDAQEASNDISFGVHPIELERRLHELLEARLQEQITDLEYALECARQKVIEKETEVTWWKDTVQLISQHVPETSRFTFRLDPEAAFKLKAEF